MATNNDVVKEILWHLPVQSLLRLRAVSKSWRNVIDSPYFRKLHTRSNNNHNNNHNNTVCLQFSFLRDENCELSIKLLDNGKSFKLRDNFDDLLPSRWQPDNDLERNKYVRFVGPVKGLICIFSKQFKLPIAICNPFLGQFKILPKSTIEVVNSPSNQCQAHHHNVGIGYDEDSSYKVVEVAYCGYHGHHHAWLYSRRTGSWRELAGGGVIDQGNLRIFWSVKSVCKNGNFAHWLGARMGVYNLERIVLTFDMRNEVFRVTKIGCVPPTDQVVTTKILAEEIMAKEDGKSFVLFHRRGNGMWGTKSVEIYESICEESDDLNWKYMVNLDEPLRGISLWRGSDYVVLKNVNQRREVYLYDYRARKLGREVTLYDYCTRKLVGRFELPERTEIIEYIGSFISVE